MLLNSRLWKWDYHAVAVFLVARSNEGHGPLYFIDLICFGSREQELVEGSIWGILSLTCTLLTVPYVVPRPGSPVLSENTGDGRRLRCACAYNFRLLLQWHIHSSRRWVWQGCWWSVGRGYLAVEQNRNRWGSFWSGIMAGQEFQMFRYLSRLVASLAIRSLLLEWYLHSCCSWKNIGWRTQQKCFYGQKTELRMTASSTFSLSCSAHCCSSQGHMDVWSWWTAPRSIILQPGLGVLIVERMDALSKFLFLSNHASLSWLTAEGHLPKCLVAPSLILRLPLWRTQIASQSGSRDWATTQCSPITTSRLDNALLQKLHGSAAYPIGAASRHSYESALHEYWSVAWLLQPCQLSAALAFTAQVTLNMLHGCLDVVSDGSSYLWPSVLRFWVVDVFRQL